MFQSIDIIYYLILLLILIMGVFVFTSDHKSKNNWVFFLFIIGAIGWMISLRIGWWYVDSGNWEMVLHTMRLAYGFSIWGMSLMTIFTYFFPRPTISFSKFVIFGYLGFTITLFLLAGFTPLVNESLVITDGTYTRDAFGPLYLVYTIDILFNLVISAYFLISKFKKSQGIEKEKIFLVIFGYLAFVVLAVLTNVILPLFNIFILQRDSQLLILAFVIPVYYSIHRYRFFNFSHFSFNFLRKTILYSIFLSVFFLAFKTIAFLIPGANLWVLNIPAAFIAAAMLGFIRKIIPQLTLGSIREFQNKIRELKTKIYVCDNYKKLRDATEGAFLLKLNFAQATIFAVRKEAGEAKLPVYIKDHFTKELLKFKKDILILEEVRFRKISLPSKKRLTSAMGGMGIDLCLPLFSEDKLIGFLGLRKSGKDKLYSNEEIKELIDLKAPLSVCLMNILLKMNLQEENDLMKSIIEEKTDELQNKLIEIRELVEQQSDFIAVTAHELRTPLSIALFQMQDILEAQKKSPKTVAELNVAYKSLENLKEMIQKMFNVQQYDLNKVSINKEKTDIKEMIQGVFKDFIPIMKERSLNFGLEDRLKGKVFSAVDQGQMRQVFHNILRNARNFTPKNGKIILAAESTKDKIIIRISDNGKGITSEFKEKIFEKFRTNHAAKGIGLGLYICKKIIELHGGKIWAEDSQWGGACFCISLNKFGSKKKVITKKLKKSEQLSVALEAKLAKAKVDKSKKKGKKK